MRVLLINHRDLKHPSAGGAEEYLFNIAKRLAAWGHEVTLFSERSRGLLSTDFYGGVKIVRRGSFLTMHLWAPIYVIRNSHNYDVIVDNIAHVIPFMSTMVTRRPVVAVVYHINGPVLKKTMSPMLWRVGILAEKSLPKLYNNIIAISEWTKNMLIKLGAPADRVWVVKPGVDHNIYKPGVKSDKPMVLWLNRLVAYKNPDHAVEIFALVKKRIPNAKFVLAGDGPERPKIVALARDLGVEVTFTGRINLQKKVELLQKAWVCLYTSDVEGWGLVAIEAAACGTPCIVYATGGLTEAVIHGKTGFHVSPGDKRSVADRIVEVLLDENLRSYLSRNAIEYSRKFDWDKSAREFEEALKSAISYR